MKYVDDNNYLIPVKGVQNKRQVAQYSMEGQLIQVYNSITEAARATGQKTLAIFLKYARVRLRRLEDMYGGTMKRVATEDILQMNSLYFQYKNFAEVARQTGFSASTVRKYVDVNWKPIIQENIKRFEMSQIPSKFNSSIFKNIDNYGDLCVLTEREQEEMKELWKELSV